MLPVLHGIKMYFWIGPVTVAKAASPGAVLADDLCGNRILTARSATAVSWPPRHRRDTRTRLIG